MKLCIISPTSELERYASQSEGVHLTLIHLVESDPVYADFYRRRSEAGDTIIMDNGTFEFGKPASPERMVEAAQKIKAHVLVAPDFPAEPIEKTLESTEQFCGMMQHLPYTVMACPQSEVGDYRGWLKAVKLFTLLPKISHIGISILACPNAFGPILGNSKDIELCRLMATYTLKDAIRGNYIDMGNKKFHYLGGGHRVDLIQYYDIADSLDTSSPVWHGYHAIKYEYGFLPNGKLRTPVDFQATINDPHDLEGVKGLNPKTIHEYIQFNIDVVKAHARKADAKVS